MRPSVIVILLLLLAASARAQRTYTQDVAITFAAPEAAAAATLTPTPVLDGKPWALSARWDDNHPGNLQMREVMARHGLKGTFYLNQTDPRNRFGQAYVEKLLEGGFSIGGHTQSHLQLKQLNAGELFYEVLANRVQREAQANQPIVSFAFPFGVYQDPADPDAIVRITETLRRSGMYHEPYLTFVKDNPQVQPGEFVTSLQVMPGDHTVDAEKFNTNLEKIFKFPQAYQKFSHNITLATHARQSGAEWDKLDALFAQLKTRADWWFCNQNEYAAYEKQAKQTRIERVSVDGATATFRLTRPSPAELGAVVPLTVEASAEVTAVKGDAAHASRGKLVNLAHPASQGVPTVIDAIDNPKNDPTPAGESTELPGVRAWLHAGEDGKLSLTLAGQMSDVHITWRLPLAFETGMQRSAVADLAAGQSRVETLTAGPLSSTPARTAGGRYYVAEVDFRHGGKPARLYATATVGQVVPNPKPAPATQPAADMTPFVIPLEVNPASAIAYKGKPIEHRITIKNGHFHAGDARFRAWGVNLCGGACFPDKPRADRIAARLEAAGINAVRMHHMDIEWSKFPDSIWDPAEPTKMSAEALDRLDYFIDQLARRGIYTNLNLHVSRTHSKHLGLPDSRATGNYDKLVDLFTPQLIAAEKDYARQLLTRTNPYRNLTYAADPAVAWVEINNENSLFMWDAPAKLKAMHPFYAGVLSQKFNAWLARRYGSSDKLATAWNAGDSTPSADVPLPAFGLIANGGAAATAANGRVDIQARGQATWNIEYRSTPLPIAAERSYTLSFRAKADAPRDLLARVGLAKAPYTILGLRQTVKLDATFKQHHLFFRSPIDTADASLSFQLGNSDIDVDIADVKLTSRPLIGVAEGESLEKANIALNLDAESPARQLDRLRFMAETEKAYYDDFRTYLQRDLACRSLITGSMAYGPLGLWAQADMDFVDTHAYWQHPVFAGQWNATKWTLDQKAMADSPQHNKLLEIAAGRLAGKPFTVTEYNHPAPLDSQAEAVPMIAATAAAQDWDGVWLFCYSSSATDSRGHFAGWFDIEANPAKWGFVPAGSAIFRDAAIAPLAGARTIRLDDPFALQARHGTSLRDAAMPLGLSGDVLTAERVHVAFTDAPVADLPDTGTVIDWTPGRFHAKGRSAEVVIDAQGRLRTDGRGFAVLTRTPMGAGQLFTVAGRVENTAMGFSADRRTVANQWGVAPTLIEKLSIKLDKPLPPGHTLHPLNPDGTIRPDAIPQSGQLTLPDSGTMWFIAQEPR